MRRESQTWSRNQYAPSVNNIYSMPTACECKCGYVGPYYKSAPKLIGLRRVGLKGFGVGGGVGVGGGGGVGSGVGFEVDTSAENPSSDITLANREVNDSFQPNISSKIITRYGKDDGIRMNIAKYNGEKSRWEKRLRRGYSELGKGSRKLCSPAIWRNARRGG